MSNSDTLRTFEEQDTEQVVRLWGEAFGNPDNHNNPERMLAEKLRADTHIVVAEQANQIKGVCMYGYDGHRGWIYALAVQPERRRQGIGSALVKEVLERLKALGCKKANLQVREPDNHLAAFYQRLGFDVEARISMGQRL